MYSNYYIHYKALARTHVKTYRLRSLYETSPDDDSLSEIRSDGTNAMNVLEFSLCHLFYFIFLSSNGFNTRTNYIKLTEWK